MAEALLRSFGGAELEVFSAGTEPAHVHPLPIEVMRDIGTDISRQHSKHLNEFLDQHFDFVITVCDRAGDNCPSFPGDNERIDWSFDDPAATTGMDEKYQSAFQRVRDEIGERIRPWVTVQRKLLREAGVAQKRQHAEPGGWTRPG